MRARSRLALLTPPLAYLGLFFLVPVGAFLAYALGSGGGLPQLARAILASPYHRERIVFTLWQAALSTVLTLAVALPIAYWIARYRFRGRRALQAVLLVPFVLPPLIVAMAFQALLGPRGPLAAAGLDGLVGPVGAILVAHVFYNLGLAVRILAGFWERVPDAFVDAARTLGASRAAAFRRVLLPMAVSPLLSAASLVFVFTASSFGIILLLGGRAAGTIETLIYEEAVSIRPHYDVAAALGLLQLAVTVLGFALYVHFQRRHRVAFPPRGGAPMDPLPTHAAPFLLAAAAFVALPLASLAASAFLYQGRIGIDGFRFLLDGSYPLGSYTAGHAVAQSLRFGLWAVAISVPLAFLMARGLQGLRAKAAALESALLSPLGASAILVALGFLIAYDGTPFWDLRASAVRLVIGHSLIAFPFVSRILAPSLDAIDPALTEAARTLGAGPWQRLLRLELPLLRPALLACAAMAFATSLGEFGATLVLRRPEFTTLPLAIYDGFSRAGEPFRAQAEALAVVLILFSLLVFWALEHARRRAGGDLG